jgi:cellulose synthase/poly-beta-1,6-N-acetylglucosamine synthase-like glycosyltransferase
LRFLFLTGWGLLAVTWLGYPVAAWVVASLRRRPTAPAAAVTPSVTAVVASRDPDEAIRRRVENLLLGDYAPDLLDVVVAIDAARGPEPTAGSEAWPARVTVVQGDVPGGKASALNAAVRHARGELLVFTDTAQSFGRGTIAALVDELERYPELAAVSGALEIGGAGGAPSAAVLYWRFERWLRETEARLHSPVGVTGAVYAMRRAEWVDLPPGLILDDLYVPMVQVLRGRRIGFRRDAVAVDPRQIDRRGEYHRKARTLTGVFQLCHLLPSVLVPFRNPIWVQFVFHKLLRLLSPFLLLVVVASGAAWLASALPVGLALAALGGLVVGSAVVLAASLRARTLAGEVMAMQAAVVQATRNALRGEWDVWRR